MCSYIANAIFTLNTISYSYVASYVFIIVINFLAKVLNGFHLLLSKLALSPYEGSLLQLLVAIQTCSSYYITRLSLQCSLDKLNECIVCCIAKCMFLSQQIELWGSAFLWSVPNGNEKMFLWLTQKQLDYFGHAAGNAMTILISFVT